MDDIVAISLFRHGLTEANKKYAYLGWTDSPLCSVEKDQIDEISREKKLVFSSDLMRCIKTADILFPSSSPELLSELREMHFGNWEGKTYDELRHKETYKQWLEDPFTNQPPGGESFNEFAERVQSGWDKVVNKIMKSHANQAAIVTHGGVIRYLLSNYTQHNKSFWDWKTPYGRGYTLIWEREALRSGETCTLLQEAPLMANQNG